MHGMVLCTWRWVQHGIPVGADQSSCPSHAELSGMLQPCWALLDGADQMMTCASHMSAAKHKQRG